MKLNKFTSLLVIGLIASVAATGCRKKPVGVTDLPGSRTGTKVVTTPVVAVPDMPPGNPIKPVENPAAIPTSDNTNGTPSNPADLHKGWIEDAVALKAETVYFDFDSSVIKASEKPKAAAVADYLKANKGKAVRVEGNCDERGTEEYNRSLGERRALALREELIRLGIGPTEVDTISYGKEKPMCTESTEACWAKNRRDHFVVPEAGQ